MPIVADNAASSLEPEPSPVCAPTLLYHCFHHLVAESERPQKPVTNLYRGERNDYPTADHQAPFPSIRPELVPRQRLIERLNAGIARPKGHFAHKLTLVSAPAGFGKTTLVNAWLRSTDQPTTWFSLDKGDNDLIRFLNYFVAALRQVDDQIGKAAQRLLEVPQLPAVEPLLTELINDIVTQSSPLYSC
ncbi:MAG: hypothetical protein GY832_40450 [Chloroflexi bacterium]|nr:hypothetical protein [Chloroflexota bacterium]